MKHVEGSRHFHIGVKVVRKYTMEISHLGRDWMLEIRSVV